jgi:hypothetical protein
MQSGQQMIESRRKAENAYKIMEAASAGYYTYYIDVI